MITAETVSFPRNKGVLRSGIIQLKEIGLWGGEGNLEAFLELITSLHFSLGGGYSSLRYNETVNIFTMLVLLRMIAVCLWGSSQKERCVVRFFSMPGTCAC